MIAVYSDIHYLIVVLKVEDDNFEKFVDWLKQTNALIPLGDVLFIENEQIISR